jgi:hypothetical protein
MPFEEIFIPDHNNMRWIPQRQAVRHLLLMELSY